MSNGVLRDTVKNSVREASDIVEVVNDYVTLKKAGNRFVGLCPFHSEKTPSFSVNPQGQFFYCFGCGESGDVFSFLMKYHHMNFPEALQLLAEKYNIQLPEREMDEGEKRRLQQREQLYVANESAAQLYQRCLKQGRGSAAARKYLEERGVPEQFVEEYRLGFAPDAEAVGWSFQTDKLVSSQAPIEALVNAGIAVQKDRGGHYDRFRSRVMFPIYDMTGRVAAFGGRIIGDGKPKYMNSPESLVFEKSRLLFGLYQHKEAIRKAQSAILVEGNFDLLLLAVNGIKNVVAPLGTSLTRQHVKSLRGYCSEVVLLFDADAAGLKAALRSIPMFLAEQLDCKIALLPEGHDPDSLIRQDGPAGIQRQVEAARPLAEFFFDSLVKQHGLTLAGKNKIVAELKPMLAEAADPSQRSLMIAHFSEKLGVAPAMFAGKSIPPVRQTQPPSPPAAQKSLRGLPRRERQVIDFLILFPEHLQQLQEAGLDTVLRNDSAKRFVALLARLQETEDPSPEGLMNVFEQGDERQYVAELLMKAGEDGEEQSDEMAQGMLNDLLHWLGSVAQQEKSERLQQQIKEAEQQGDIELLMSLLQQKMDNEKKRTGY